MPSSNIAIVREKGCKRSPGHRQRKGPAQYAPALYPFLSEWSGWRHQLAGDTIDKDVVPRPPDGNTQALAPPRCRHNDSRILDVPTLICEMTRNDRIDRGAAVVRDIEDRQPVPAWYDLERWRVQGNQRYCRTCSDRHGPHQVGPR